MNKVYLPVSDSIILSHLKNDEFDGWQMLIDKYAPMMYGCIYKLTGETELTGEILEKVFSEISKPEIIKQFQISPGIYLFHFTHSLTIRYLNDMGILPVDETDQLYAQFTLLKLLFCDQLSLNEAAKKLNISTVEAGIQLREESNRLRNRSAFNKLSN